MYDDHGVERRMPQRRGGSRGSEDDGEVYMGGVRRQVPRFEHAHQCDQGIHTEPLDEVTKRMKVKVSDFFGRLNPDAFHDWIIALEDYFDWFSVPEERKVQFVKLKLKGPACAWWSSVVERL